MLYPFLIDKEYIKKDIYKIIGVPVDTHGGNWDTGYNRHIDDFFIFSNIDTYGRTGHDYDNHFVGELFYWTAKSRTTLEQPQIQQLLNPPGFIYFFYRFDNTKPWIFAGTGIPISAKNTSPVQIIWKINGNKGEDVISKSELKSLPPMFAEITKHTSTINIYEQNPEVRKRCIDFWGCQCAACGFDFENVYGEIGKGFIHVHYLKPLSQINEHDYIDPPKDLRPICPNCHSMIHRKTPALTIEELKTFLKG